MCLAQWLLTTFLCPFCKKYKVFWVLVQTYIFVPLLQQKRKILIFLIIRVCLLNIEKPTGCEGKCVLGWGEIYVAKKKKSNQIPLFYILQKNNLISILCLKACMLWISKMQFLSFCRLPYRPQGCNKVRMVITYPFNLCMPKAHSSCKITGFELFSFTNKQRYFAVEVG